MSCALDRLEDEYQIYETEEELKQLMLDFKIMVDGDFLGFKELTSKRNLNLYFAGIENFDFEDCSAIGTIIIRIKLIL